MPVCVCMLLFCAVIHRKPDFASIPFNKVGFNP